MSDTTSHPEGEAYEPSKTEGRRANSSGPADSSRNDVSDADRKPERMAPPVKRRGGLLRFVGWFVILLVVFPGVFPIAVLGCTQGWWLALAIDLAATVSLLGLGVWCLRKARAQGMPTSGKAAIAARVVCILYCVGAVTLAISWASGAGAETGYWQFLLLWSVSAVTFIAALGFLLLSKVRAGVYCMIAGGILVLPVGLLAILVGMRTMKATPDGRGSSSGFLGGLAAVLCIMMIAHATSPAPDWNRTGTFRGAPFSWCGPGSLTALLRGAPYDDVRDRELLCLNVATNLRERVRFGHLGLTHEHMRRANRILREDLKKWHETGTVFSKSDYRDAFNAAQRKVMAILIPAIDRNTYRETGLLPILVVDDAVTTRDAVTRGAGIFVELVMLLKDTEEKPGP